MADFLFPLQASDGDLVLAQSSFDQVRSLILSYLSVNRGDRICDPGWGQPILPMLENNQIQFRLEDIRRDLVAITQPYRASIEVVDNIDLDGKIRVRWSLRSGESAVEILNINP